MFTRKPDRSAEKPAAVNSDTDGAADNFTAASTKPVQLSTPLKGSSQMVPSIIGEDLTVEGNVISKGELQLEGEIRGDCRCASLVVGDKALIEGGVLADDVIVRGRVVGSIRGQRVTLQASSHVEGDIFHQSLAIEQGAYFEGKSRRSDDPLADAKSSAPVKPGFVAAADTGSSTQTSRSIGGDDDKSPTSTRAAE